MKTLRVMLSIDTDSKPAATTKPRAASVTIPLLQLIFRPKYGIYQALLLFKRRHNMLLVIFC